MRRHGFTMIELLVVVSVASILVLLAAPSFSDFILMQRLKGVTAQLTTDLQLARSEAAARNLPVRVRFSENASQSCYVLFVGNLNACQCTAATVCAADATEIRTVSAARRLDVHILVPTFPNVARLTDIELDPATGGIRVVPTDARDPAPDRFTVDTEIDAKRRFRTEVSLSGRPRLCRPAGSTVDAPAC